jgi:hypothetical protein
MSNLNAVGQIKMNFDFLVEDKTRKKIVENLSGIAITHSGKYLWLGTDEFSALERLEKLDNGGYGNHNRFELKNIINNFDPHEGEVDIEGIDFSDGYLWIIGSHSSKRKKVEVEATKFQVEDNELKNIKRESNRYLLARIPIDGNGKLGDQSPERAWLKRDGSNDSLTKALAKDEYLNLAQLIKDGGKESLPEADFYFYLPSKENGLDIEGLAVQGNKIFIGLRGPVLRGIAILLEIEVEENGSHELNLKKIGDDGREYKRHFLDLDGLGMRELCFENGTNNLIVLAGPTMDLDGNHALFRLKQPLTLSDNSLSSQKNKQLDYLGDIPHGKKCDRAEGLTLYDDGSSILVVYDSPSNHRLILDNQEKVIGVCAEQFSLPK